MGSDYSKLYAFKLLFVNPDIYTLELLDSIPISGVGQLSVGDFDGDGRDEVVLSSKGITVFDFDGGFLIYKYNFPYGGYLEIG